MMKQNAQGNFDPWAQPPYGCDDQDRPLTPEPGYEILPPNTRVAEGDRVWDVYCGWMTPDGYHARMGYYAQSSGRWTTWARKSSGSEREKQP